jgi:hypothetical protein
MSLAVPSSSPKAEQGHNFYDRETGQSHRKTKAIASPKEPNEAVWGSI